MGNQPVVLYVEDDPASRRIMRMMFEKRMALERFTILETSQNFREVVLALDPKPDVVFLDIRMQPHDGFAMLRILRELEWFRSIPVIALTASVMNDEVEQLRQAGFNGCLAKPIDLTTFPDSFRQILGREAVWRILA